MGNYSCYFGCRVYNVLELEYSHFQQTVKTLLTSRQKKSFKNPLHFKIFYLRSCWISGCIEVSTISHFENFTFYKFNKSNYNIFRVIYNFMKMAFIIQESKGMQAVFESR